MALVNIMSIISFSLLLSVGVSQYKYLPLILPHILYLYLLDSVALHQLYRPLYGHLQNIQMLSFCIIVKIVKMHYKQRASARKNLGSFWRY